MFYKSEGKILEKGKIAEVLGVDFYNELLEIKEQAKLDRTIFGYFNTCFKVNEVLSNDNFFLKFFGRRDVFRFLIQKKVQGKNKLAENLSSSAVEKFNGYEMIRRKLECKENIDLTPIDIAYEPSYDENIPAPCFFTGQIFLAYKSYIGRIDRSKECIFSRAVKQCHFCENLFAKNEEAMKKHLTICAAREGITYSFNNGQIINFQDNFKYLGDVPFTVYFDFETTAGDSVFFDPKMFVVSYCQIYSFHPSLNLDKVVIYWSFQQTADEIYDLNHSKREHIPFFNKTTFYQLKDTASAVLAHEKSTSLAELFSMELKFIK